MRRHDYPILEYDDSRTAKLNPVNLGEAPLSTDKLVIAFFGEAMERLQEEGKMVSDRKINGENPIVLYRFTDADVLITRGYVGCPACAARNWSFTK